MTPAHLHLGHRLIVILTGITSLRAGKLAFSAVKSLRQALYDLRKGIGRETRSEHEI